MITERTLKRWRKEALETQTYLESIDHNQVKINPMETILLKTSEYVLRTTQELLDLHLIRK